MPVLESTQAADPKKLHEQTNQMAGRWRAAGRSAVLIGIFVTLLMLTAFFINPVALPRIEANHAQPRGGWAVAIAISFLMGIAMGAFLLTVLALLVRASHFEIYGDRLRMRCGIVSREIRFGEIDSVESWTVPAPFWPRAGSFWKDMKEQFNVHLLKPHIMQMGHGQFLEPSAELIVIKTHGTGWWQGYLLEVDHAGTFRAKLDEAVSTFRSAA